MAKPLAEPLGFLLVFYLTTQRWLFWTISPIARLESWLVCRGPVDVREEPATPCDEDGQAGVLG